MTDCEIWKNILGYEGLYMVSDCGNVKSLKRKCVKEDKILLYYKNRTGYFQVFLYKDGKRKTYLISRLVGFAFLEPVDGCKTIDHVNRIKTDNRASNLRWANCSMQNQNRDYVLNAKYIYIAYIYLPRIVSHWQVKWRYDGENVKTKYFMTKALADAFADTLDKTRLISI